LQPLAPAVGVGRVADPGHPVQGVEGRVPGERVRVERVLGSGRGPVGDPAGRDPIVGDHAAGLAGRVGAVVVGVDVDPAGLVVVGGELAQPVRGPVGGPLGGGLGRGAAVAVGDPLPHGDGAGRVIAGPHRRRPPGQVGGAQDQRVARVADLDLGAAGVVHGERGPGVDRLGPQRPPGQVEDHPERGPPERVGHLDRVAAGVEGVPGALLGDRAARHPVAGDRLHDAPGRVGQGAARRVQVVGGDE
jgi:hypothetical protein